MPLLPRDPRILKLPNMPDLIQTLKRDLDTKVVLGANVTRSVTSEVMAQAGPTECGDFGTGYGRWGMITGQECNQTSNVFFVSVTSRMQIPQPGSDGRLHACSSGTDMIGYQG